MKHVHFLGIGGSGASAAAAIAQAQGYDVTGCDLSPQNEFTTTFEPSQLYTGHNPKHLENVDILAVTPAIFSLDPNNSELREARKRGTEILTWQEFLGKYLTKDKFIIAVCGTHGKTTTTAMVAKILEDAGLDPTVLLGGIVPEWGTNYRVGKGKFMVLEADEFNDNFLPTKPDIAVVTNIEMDHPEYFKDINAVKESFKKFMLQTKQTIVCNLLDVNIAELLKDVMKQVPVSGVDFTKNELGFSLKIPGSFNELNAKAAMQVGLMCGIDPAVISKSLQSYSGVGKRFEFIGKFNDSQIYSDFGHHPTEIKVTMDAVRQKFPDKRIILVYQPHMFSRTKALFSDFVKVFKNLPTDKAFIMDIYPSREIDTGLVTSQQLVDAISKPSITYIGKTGSTLEKLKPEIKPEDIVFFMSAGDTDKLAKELAG